MNMLKEGRKEILITLLSKILMYERASCAKRKYNINE